MSYFVILCHIMLYCVILCYFMLFYVILCYFMLFYVILCYFMLYCVILCYFMLFYVTLCHISTVLDNVDIKDHVKDGRCLAEQGYEVPTRNEETVSYSDGYQIRIRE